MAQRNLSPHDLEYVLEYGKRLNRTGLTMYVLRKKDIPENDRSNARITRLEGTTVLAASTRNGSLCIVTTYRDKNAFKAIRMKAKYNRNKRVPADLPVRAGR